MSHLLNLPNILQSERRLQPPLSSCDLYTDATLSSAAAFIAPQPTSSLATAYSDTKPIAWAEMAMAMKGLDWAMDTWTRQPTTITLSTDSTIVHHTLCKGTGSLLFREPLLQDLYI